jgi:hypothetical protein
MTFDDIKTHFGSVEKARLALGFKSRQAIYRWKYAGGIPEPQQFRIQVLTGGALHADSLPEKAAA